MSPLAQRIVKILSRCKGRELARTSKSIAKELREADDRRVRAVIAEELDAIAAALLPSVLVAMAPVGFWLMSQDQEALRMEANAYHMRRTWTEKHAQIVRILKAAGFGAILPKRKAVAA